MADIFISYKREDRTRIAPLARALEARGYTVWWDLELVPGQKWAKKIKAELDAAKCVIVVWTQRSVEPDGTYASEWVENEANTAKARGILVPVLLDAGRIAWSHQQVQYATLIGWTGDSAAPGFADLIEGVTQFAGARARPEEVELAAWTTAERTETAQAFRDFLAAHPGSRFADIARGRAAELDEAAAWQALGAAPTIAALAGFLRRFPSGRFADEAETRIKALEVASARGAGAAAPTPPAPPKDSPTAARTRSSARQTLPQILPQWLIPAGAAGLALVAVLIWSPWRSTNGAAPPSPPPPAVAAPPAATPGAPVETRPEAIPSPPVAAPSIPLPNMAKFYIELPDGSLRAFDDTQITVEAARQALRSELGRTLPDLDVGGFKFSPLTTLDQLATGFNAGVKDLGAGATGLYADTVDALGSGVGSLLGLPRGAPVPNVARDISLSLSQSATADRAAQRNREAPSATLLRSVPGPMEFTDWETAPEVAGNLARQVPAALVDSAGGMIPGLLGGRAVQGLAGLSTGAKAALGAGVGIGAEALQASGSITGEVVQEIELLARENPERLISTPKGRSAWERSGGDFERTISILQDEASRSIGLPTIASTAAFAALTPGEARLYAGVGGGRGFAADVARAFLFEGSEEAAQEATQQAIENYGIMGIDPQRKLGDKVLESAYVGGIAGGFAGGLFEGAASISSGPFGRPERQYAQEAADRVTNATAQVVNTQAPIETPATSTIDGAYPRP